MHAYPIAKFGIDHLQPVDLPTPEAAPGTVLIQVHAVSLNYRDLMMVKGLYNPKMTLPRIPCSDGAGEVVAVGAGVTRVQPGDRVCAIFQQQWLEGPLTAVKSRHALGGDIDGMLTEYALLPEDGVVRLPPHLSYEEAATLPCAAVTAWNALHHAGDPASPAQPGDTVLIQGTGGVSVFALQFAKLLGLNVIGTSSSDEKLARARALGLDEACNYKQTPDWSKWAFEITGGLGPNRIVEVCGANTLGQSLRAIRVGGLIAQIGVLSGAVPADPLALTPILLKQVRIQGIYVGSRAMFEQMNASIAAAKLHPVVDRVFNPDQVREAFHHMESAAHFGKIVIRVSER